jgi:thiol:disulfide interchange protein DsbC
MSISRHFLPTLALSLCFSSAASGFQLFHPKDDKKEDKSLVSKMAKEAHVSMGQKTELSAEAIKTLLEIKLQGIEIESVVPSPKEGIYQAFFNGQMLYATSDGEFVFTGNLLGLTDSTPVNYTEIAMTARAAEMSPQRAEKIASINEDDMVVFKAPNEKYVISVFTDVDCAYCRKLHKEVPQLNANGVTVRYLAFPRAGVGSSAYDKLVSIWCAEDKQIAMNDAKLERKFSPKTCINPIESQYSLTRELGLSGTPALVLPDGELIAGYLPFQRLVDHLEKKEEANAAAGK